MSYSLIGTIEGSTYSVRWDNGELSGDQYAVDRVRERAEALEGKRVGAPTGPFTYRNHLANPLSSVFVIAEVFDRVTGQVGNVPRLPPIPVGAVA